MKNPAVSIIVPNFNHVTFLSKRLESIFSQTFQDFEIILLDDNSSDSSIEVLKKYSAHPKVSRFIVNKTNSGSPFKQWEKGIGLANGEYVWIAESDDSCEVNFLENLINNFDDRDVALVYSQSKRIDTDGNVIGNWIDYTSQFSQNPFLENFIMEGNIFIEKYLIHKNVIPNVSAVLFCKKHLQRILPLNQSPCFRYNADWFYYIQLLSQAKVVFVAESLNNFREHTGSVIAQASGRKGLIEILKLELEGGKKMIQYLKDCRLDNTSEIKKQSKLKIDSIYLSIAKEYVYRRQFAEGIATILFKPHLWRKYLPALRKI